MRPRMTIFNSISLDGKVTGFDTDLDLYYGISSQWGNDGVLVGSGTVLKSMEQVPEETEEDMHPSRTADDASLPYVIFVDSRGRIRSHHIFRKQPYIREVMVLISAETPDDYRRYLEERKYQYIETGKDRVDLVSAMEILNVKFGLKNLRTDSGGSLNTALINQDLVDRIVVLMDPVIAGGGNTPIFEELGSLVKLRMERIEGIDDRHILISYEVERRN